MIEINNLTTNPIDEEFLKRVAKKVLEGENREKVDLSVALVGQGRIRELNKKYKKKNRVTDVLAFPGDGLLDEVCPPWGLPSSRPFANAQVGEVVICLREVKKNAKRFGLAFEKELARVLIHGILHLLGEDHEISEKKAKEMEDKQKHYIEICQRAIL